MRTSGVVGGAGRGVGPAVVVRRLLLSSRKVRSVIRKIALVVYVVIGIVVASSHHYFAHVGGIKGIISAVLAVALWPLVLFGVSLHIR